MSAPVRVPLVDLGWQHAQIAAEVEPLLADAMAAGRFIGGDDVVAFEEEFAQACAATACIGVANGTDAIELVLRASGVGEGHRVVVPANTFIATVEGVMNVGALPVFVDVDEHHLIDVAAATKAMEGGARVVMPVHLYGQAAASAELAEVAAANGATLVEDAAQSQGARVGSGRMGTHARAATTSFYPGKNLGAYGDAGAVVTSDADLADAVRLLANHGSRRRYVHEVIGRNSRLDALQAIVLRAKLRRLEGWNDLRREAATRYNSMLADLDIATPMVKPGHDHVWHLYVVRVANRDVILGHLNAAGIGAAIHYPTPAHLHEATRHLGHAPGDFPASERAAAEILSLPMYPGITEAQQHDVVEALTSALRA